MKTVEITYRYEARDAPPRPRPADSDAALLRLDEGNRAFAALLDGLTDDGSPARRIVPVDPRDLGLLTGESGAARQRPFAAVLGCADARVPIELVFNEGPNDLFVVRVAGNGLGPEVLGSLKYAVERLGGSLKLIVVLGHSGCGAVSAAVDVFLNPGDYLPFATKHSLRNILDRLLIVVHASARNLLAAFGPGVVDHPGYRQVLIEFFGRHQCRARRLFDTAGDRDRRSGRAARGLRRLPARDPRGMDAAPGQDERDWFGCTSS